MADNSIHLRDKPRQPASYTEKDITVGPVTLHTSFRAITVNGGDPVLLKAAQVAALHLLMSSPDKLVSKEALINRVYGMENAENPRDASNIRVIIFRLRTILERAGASRKAIAADRDTGYIFKSDCSVKVVISFSELQWKEICGLLLQAGREDLLKP